MIWTHSICEDCWDLQHPDRKAHRIAAAGDVLRRFRERGCCFCGEAHHSGIFVRADPATTPYCQCAPEN
jgi:hypothetical protein